jgi:hypothetical protein
MGGGVTQDVDFATRRGAETAMRPLGRLPDAPMVMPKQRLEARTGEGGWLARLIRRPSAVAGPAPTRGN